MIVLRLCCPARPPQCPLVLVLGINLSLSLPIDLKIIAILVNVAHLRLGGL